MVKRLVIAAIESAFGTSSPTVNGAYWVNYWSMYQITQHSSYLSNAHDKFPPEIRPDPMFGRICRHAANQCAFSRKLYA